MDRRSPRLQLAVLLLLALPHLDATTAEAPGPDDILQNIETLIPKRETGASDFLKKHPTYDGRGVVIAIFDTGVDPMAAGLRRTTTGQPKVIEIIDTTGSGDVDLAPPARPTADGTLKGRTGRTLTLPEGITNPSGEYRLGLKLAGELFAKQVMDRIRDDRSRVWDQQKRDLFAGRNRQREADEKAGNRPAPTKPEADLSPAERDVLARESLLDGLIGKHDAMDPEPVYDCVVWHDGTHWRVLVDTDEDGDLRDETLLRPFGIAQETGLFAGKTGSRYGVQVYDEGRVLSIVTVIGSHGTHVAGIAAAHFPDEPARNGIAPGAQIVSVKIGDTRLGSSSDSTGYLRAIAACAQHNVDVMNMSFGGPSAYQDGNNTSNRLIRALVQDYGVTAFISAGNAGPSLSTIGAPGDTPEAIGVGAYVSKAMAAALYAAPEGSAETTFGFTSRGPMKSGGLGVHILGPGGAIAPVAFDSLASSQLMNGTSMSAPSVAGVGALLISGAKQAGLKTTPARIKAALMNTARPVEGVEPWAQGPGLAQTGLAFEHLKAHQTLAALDIHFRAETNDNTLAKGPGLYWREGRQPGRQEVRLSVAPQFPESIPIEVRQAFEENLVLESTESWVEVPRFLHLGNSTRNFTVRVDVPEAGPVGGAHFAEIRAYSATRREAGPVLRIPVTVITPRRGDPVARPQETFAAKLDAGGIGRFFFEAPANASHMRLRVRRDRGDLLARSYVLHATSLVSHEAFTSGRVTESMRLEPGQEREVFVPVGPGRTVELVWHQQWNSPGASALECEFSWIGLGSRDASVVVTGNLKYGTAVLRSAYAALPVELSGKLTEAVMLFAPVETRVLPGDERDILPPSPRDSGPMRQPVLRQKFEFKVEKTFKARLGPPRQSLPFSEVMGSITRIYHESGRQLWNGSGNSFGSGRAEIEFPKGKITAYRDLRAIDVADVERQSAMPLVLRREMPGSAGLGIYTDALTAAQAKRETKTTLAPGRDHDFYFEEPDEAPFKDLAPKPAWFVGEIEVVSEKQTLLKLPVVYQRGVTPPEAKRPPGEPGKPKRTPIEDAREELYQKQLSLAKGLRMKKDAESIAAHEALLAELIALRPDDPALALERALAIATRAGLIEPQKPGPEKKPASGGETGEGESKEGAPAEDEEKKTEETAAATAAPAPDRDAAAREVLELIAGAVAKIDTTAVAAFFGAPESAPPDDKEARRELAVKRKDMTTLREQLRDFALLKAEVQLALGRTADARGALLEAQRWEANASSPCKKWREVEFGVLKAEGHLGLAMQVLQDHMMKDDPLDRKVREKRVALLRELGWTIWADREELKLAVEKGTLHPRF